MWIVRAAERGDTRGLIDLASALGSGMTTLPPDPRTIAAKIERSTASFAETAGLERGEYLLVLEDTSSGALLGTSAVYAHVGLPDGFYSYKRVRLVQRARSIGVEKAHDLLVLCNDFTGTTEVGSLAVRPGLRGSGAGRLLARSRYLLIASQPHLFAETVMAELRGYQDPNGRNAFWEAVGARFFDMPFADASRMAATRGNEFIAELMPRHPVYLTMLPPDAAAVIGRPHENSAPAMAMLREEGFAFHNYVDVFDAGPQLSVERDRIRTVRESGTAAAVATKSVSTDCEVLVATPKLADFRAVQTWGEPKGDELALSLATLNALGLQEEDRVRWTYGRVRATRAPS